MHLAKITVDGVPVRQSLDPESKVIASLQAGQLVAVLGHQRTGHDSVMKIRLDGGKTGYIPSGTPRFTFRRGHLLQASTLFKTGDRQDIVAELPAGTQIDIGQTYEKKGEKYVEAATRKWRSGYVLGNTPVDWGSSDRLPTPAIIARIAVAGTPLFVLLWVFARGITQDGLLITLSLSMHEKAWLWWPGGAGVFWYCILYLWASFVPAARARNWNPSRSARDFLLLLLPPGAFVTLLACVTIWFEGSGIAPFKAHTSEYDPHLADSKILTTSELEDMTRALKAYSSGYVRGRVITVRKRGSQLEVSPLFRYLPVDIRAEDPSQVDTIVAVEYEEVTLGYYGGQTDKPANETRCEISVIDRRYGRQTTTETIWGGGTPFSSSHGESGGSPDGAAIIRYVEKLPRIER